MHEVVAIIALLMLGGLCSLLGIGYAHDAWASSTNIWMMFKTPGKIGSLIILIEGLALIVMGIVKLFNEIG